MLLNSKFSFPLLNFFSQNSGGDSLPSLMYDALFNQVFVNEYSRLAEHGHTYLDHAGAALYGKSQLERHFELLNLCALGNPNNATIPNVISTLVETTRNVVTAHFRAHDYHCILTPNTTQTIQMLARRYPFDASSQLLVLADNRNTYSSLTEACKQYEYSLLQEDLTIHASQLEAQLDNRQASSQKLFVLPAQSEISGVQHDLRWVQEAQRKGWDVLLDAEAYAANSSLNLNDVQPDFVTLSFQKMFGYPSGIGCLLVKKNRIDKLLATNHLNDLQNALENGNIDYFQVPAVKIGLDFIEEIGIDRIQGRIISLSNYLYQHLRRLKHRSGKPVVRIYGPEDRGRMGGTLLMNVLDASGRKYPYEQVGIKAREKSISICPIGFSNSGSFETIQHTSSDDPANCFVNSKVACRNLLDYDNFGDGAIRVSVGISTLKKDLDALIQFVQSFVDDTV